MIELIKGIIGSFFGKHTSMVLIGLLISLGGGYIGFLYLTNEKLEAQLAQSEIVIADRDKAVKELEKTNKHLDDQIALVKRQNELAIENRIKLENELSNLRADYNDQMEVFNKERGRFGRLFEAKAQLVVNRANAGTKRVFNEFEKASASTN